MKDIDLLKAIGGLDDQLLAEYERGGKRPRRWVRWGALAACLCIVVAAALTLPIITGNTDTTPQPVVTFAPGGAPGVVDIPGSSAPGSVPPSPQPEVYYNTAAPLVDCSPVKGFAIFGEPLDEADLETAAPDMRLEWMELSGSAGFYGWGELAAVWLNIANEQWGGRVSVTLTPADMTVYDRPVPTPDEDEPIATVIGGTEFFVYLFDFGDRITLTAEHEREGVVYMFSVDTDADHADRAKGDLYDVMSCYAATNRVPDLASITARHSDQWLNQSLTEAEAREDVDFGAYLPMELPQGFTEEDILRFRGNGQDYLSGVWTRGYDEFRWTVSSYTERDAARLTSVADTQNYDLSLYPIPRADSVPVELREIVDNPIFSIDELTMGAVSARAYVSDEQGDTDGWRMRFSVRYGNVVVEVSSKGVSPDWVYRQLTDIEY